MLRVDNTTVSGSVANGATSGLNIFWVVAYFIEAFAIILFNLLTIITFTINRHLRKRSIYCVINLAVADMLFGIEESVSRILMWKIYDRIDCDLLKNCLIQNNAILWRNVSSTVIVSGTMFSLALVAVERMCATVWPVRHRNAAPWAYTLAISMTWTAAAVSGLVMAIVIMSTKPKGEMSAFRAVCFFSGLEIAVVVGVICVSYLMIFIKVKQQQKQMAGHRISGRDQRLVMTLFIVTVASIGTWIPIALFRLLAAWNAVLAPQWGLAVVIFFAFSNSLINPIIYVFRMRDFRKALLRLISTCGRDRRTLVVPRQDTAAKQRLCMREFP